MTLPAFDPGASGVKVSDDERVVIAEFLVGYGVLWLALTAMTESPNTARLAAALAGAVALGATFLYLREAVGNLGLGGTSTMPTERKE